MSWSATTSVVRSRRWNPPAAPWKNELRKKGEARCSTVLPRPVPTSRPTCLCRGGRFVPVLVLPGEAWAGIGHSTATDDQQISFRHHWYRSQAGGRRRGATCQRNVSRTLHRRLRTTRLLTVTRLLLRRLHDRTSLRDGHRHQGTGRTTGCRSVSILVEAVPVCRRCGLRPISRPSQGLDHTSADCRRALVVQQ